MENLEYKIKRDKFLTKAIDKFKYGSYDFSSWGSFGSLWVWAKAQDWYTKFCFNKLNGGYAAYPSSKMIIPDKYINPDLFANAVYEFLKEMNEKKCIPEKWDKDAIAALLRFGRKNSGPWDDTKSIDKNGHELSMPDEDDTDLIAAAPELYKALEDLLTRLTYDKDIKKCFQKEQERAGIALAKARGKTMSDITKRLHELSRAQHDDSSTANEPANEIGRLTKEIEKLQTYYTDKIQRMTDEIENWKSLAKQINTDWIPANKKLIDRIEKLESTLSEYAKKN
jgi:hypothetical protein